jgi:ABC-type branched-subunit amino acid transport system permease subunit
VCTAAAASVVIFLGLSVLTNLGGQLSLCHAALAAIGATTFANLASVMPWGLALLGGALMVVPMAVAISLVAGRVSEVALAIATFGLANLLVSLAYGTGWMFGATGTRVAPRPNGLSGDASYFVLVALIAVVCCLAVALANRARPGRLFRALAAAPDTLDALGASPVMTRAALFGLGGLLAGLGGALAAGGNLSTSGIGYSSTLSLLWVAALAFGGRGVVLGGIRAGVAVVIVPYLLDPILGGHTTWLFGVVAVAVAVAGSVRLRTA